MFKQLRKKNSELSSLSELMGYTKYFLLLLDSSKLHKSNALFPEDELSKLMFLVQVFFEKWKAEFVTVSYVC